MARSLLLACGIVSSVVYVAANAAGALRWEEYRSLSQTISELSAIGAPSRPLMVPLGLAYAALAMAFGVGVWRAAGGNRALRVAGGLFVGYGAVCATGPFTPMHLRGAAASLTDTLHLVGTGVDVVFIMLILGFAVAARRSWFRLYTVATMVVLLVFGGLTSLYGPRVAANLPTPWAGLFERVCIYGFLAWVAVFAALVWRATSDRVRPAASARASRQTRADSVRANVPAGAR